MGTLILRIVVGLLFVGHGLQKLAGLFGGGGLKQTEQMMGAIGMHPVKLQARAAGLAEAAGGAALALGAATPLASAGLIATMLTAIRKVHAKNGLWNARGGSEFNLVIIAAAALLAERPGRTSVDAAFGRSRWGVAGVAFALLAGAVGSTLAIEAGKRYASDSVPDPAPGGASAQEQPEDAAAGSDGVPDAPDA